MANMINLLEGAVRVVRRRGVGFLWYLAAGYAWPKCAYHLVYEWPRKRLKLAMALALLTGLAVLVAVVALLTGLLVALLAVTAGVTLLLVVLSLRKRNKLRCLRQMAEQLTDSLAKKRPAYTRLEELGLDAASLQRIERAQQQTPATEVVIGRIDRDGRVLGLYGAIPGTPAIAPEDFVERSRFSLDLVLDGEHVLIRKDFRGDDRSFIREWSNLALLSGRANVPALHHVDLGKTWLYKNFIAGVTVRDLLVRAGARILLNQTETDAELAGLTPAQRIEAVWGRGRAHLPAAVPPAFIEALETQLNRIHGVGVVGVSVTYGNIIVDRGGIPWLIDLERAQSFPDVRSFWFGWGRDRDRETFNQCYGRNVITEKSARRLLAEQSQKLNGWYAPIDFGHGLATPDFWSTDSGTGRWAYFNGPILDPLVRGKRILDLGSNNAIMPMLMLRAGAKEVVGLEMSADFIGCARRVHELFEWRDVRSYPLVLHQCNMLEVLRADWGKFDIVTAYCSLYYLQPEEMAAVTRKAAELAPMFILQAKTDTRREATENKSEKSSVPFLKDLLEENGFPQVEVFAPADFNRPILIGRR